MVGNYNPWIIRTGVSKINLFLSLMDEDLIRYSSQCVQPDSSLAFKTTHTLHQALCEFWSSFVRRIVIRGTESTLNNVTRCKSSGTLPWMIENGCYIFNMDIVWRHQLLLDCWYLVYIWEVRDQFLTMACLLQILLFHCYYKVAQLFWTLPQLGITIICFVGKPRCGCKWQQSMWAAHIKKKN